MILHIAHKKGSEAKFVQLTKMNEPSNRYQQTVPKRPDQLIHQGCFATLSLSASFRQIDHANTESTH